MHIDLKSFIRKGCFLLAIGLWVSCELPNDDDLDKKIEITGQITNKINGQPLPDVKFFLHQVRQFENWRIVDSFYSAANGNFSVKIIPDENIYYKLSCSYSNYYTSAAQWAIDQARTTPYAFQLYPSAYVKLHCVNMPPKSSADTLTFGIVSNYYFGKRLIGANVDTTLVVEIASSYPHQLIFSHKNGGTDSIFSHYFNLAAGDTIAQEILY